MAKKEFSSSMIGLLGDGRKDKNKNGNSKHSNAKDVEFKDLKVNIKTGDVKIDKLESILDDVVAGDMGYKKFAPKMQKEKGKHGRDTEWQKLNLEINNFFKRKSKLWKSDADIAKHFCNVNVAKVLMKYMKENGPSNAVLSVYSHLFLAESPAIRENTEALSEVMDFILGLNKSNSKAIKKIVGKKATAASLILVGLYSQRNIFQSMSAIMSILYRNGEMSHKDFDAIIRAVMGKHQMSLVIKFLLREKKPKNNVNEDAYEAVNKWLTKTIGGKDKEDIEKLYKDVAKLNEYAVKDKKRGYNMRTDLTEFGSKDMKKVAKNLIKGKRGKYLAVMAK